MPTIKDNLHEVLATIPTGVQLVAVSKYHPMECVAEAYEAGCRVFGENHAQEMARKAQALPVDIQWHFIGHLQRNKVRQIIPYVTMIESVDSTRLMLQIEKEAHTCGKTIDVLLELHIAQEETKTGFSMQECRAMLGEGVWRQCQHIRICGLMMMASNTDDEQQIRSEFMKASQFFDEIKQEFFSDEDYFKEKSWGMSSDYQIAISCHSTMVRIGTRIFGERTY